MLTKAHLLPESTYGKWKYLVCRGKEKLAVSKGMERASSASFKLQGRGGTYGTKNLILLIKMKEDWNPIELNTWECKTISGCL